MKLLIDVQPNTFAPNAFEIAGPWSETDPVEHMNDRPVTVGRRGGADQLDREHCGQRSGEGEGGCAAVHGLLDHSPSRTFNELPSSSRDV